MNLDHIITKLVLFLWPLSTRHITYFETEIISDHYLGVEVHVLKTESNSRHPIKVSYDAYNET